MADNYKDGGNSRFAPGSLMERYEKSLKDPELLTLNREVALVRARLDQLKERAEEDVDLVVWKNLVTLWREFTIAIAEGNIKRQNEFLGKLNSFIDRADTHLGTWRDIDTTIRLLARVSEAENRRLQAVEGTYTAEQVLYLLTTSIQTLKEIVFKYADPHAARRILTDASVYHKRLISTEESAPDPD